MAHKWLITKWFSKKQVHRNKQLEFKNLATKWKLTWGNENWEKLAHKWMLQNLLKRGKLNEILKKVSHHDKKSVKRNDLINFIKKIFFYRTKQFYQENYQNHFIKSWFSDKHTESRQHYLKCLLIKPCTIEGKHTKVPIICQFTLHFADDQVVITIKRVCSIWDLDY